VTNQNAQPSALAVYTFADEDLFKDLAPAQLARVARAISYADYSSGQIFYAPEEHGDRLYILRRGRVRIYKLSPEGRALTLLVLEPMSVFGEMALVDEWQHDSFAEAMSDCTVGTIGRDEMRLVLNTNPTIALRFMNIMSQRLRAMESKLADIAFKSVPQRLATVLLNLADTHGEQPDNTPLAIVRYTHQQLAEMIGSYRETITKAIGEFREAGLIRVEEDAIYLTDLPRLRELVGR
jgi:CRP/FNR family transcriptional regulator, cyclic AMP receptor protein